MLKYSLTIPKSVSRNAAKALDRLFSAAIEVPAAYLEGIAEEKIATTRARVKLIETNASQIAEQMHVDPGYAKAAVRKFGQKILREQVNLDLVSEHAVRELQGVESSDMESEGGSIEDDWLNHFEKEAAQRSSEDMQRIFGKILAGEVQRPSSFSIRALKIMGEIDQSTAALFQRLCSACIVQRIPGVGQVIDTRVPSLGGNAGKNSLQKYGFHFGNLNILEESGLIISDYNSYMNYSACISNKSNEVRLSFTHQNIDWGLVPTEERTEGQSLNIHGVSLSRAGRELYQVIDYVPIVDYTNDLREFFLKQHLAMTPVSSSKKT